MADDYTGPEVTSADVHRTVRKLREAYDSDPERYAGLRLLLDEAPGDDYDVNETPEQRAERDA